MLDRDFQGRLENLQDSLRGTVDACGPPPQDCEWLGVDKAHSEPGIWIHLAGVWVFWHLPIDAYQLTNHPLDSPAA